VGPGLPDRDYYVSEDADSKEKERNTLHVAKMLGFLAKNLPKLKYMNILALEIEMSKPRFDRVGERKKIV
jgi:endothelin-converting enzyme/putative endopeptidase